eukprot:528710-Pleurochrysis_carterae.AAC.2
MDAACEVRFVSRELLALTVILQAAHTFLQRSWPRLALIGMALYKPLTVGCMHQSFKRRHALGADNLSVYGCQSTASLANADLQFASFDAAELSEGKLNGDEREMRARSVSRSIEIACEVDSEIGREIPREIARRVDRSASLDST